MSQQETKNPISRMKSVQLISKLPVVESTYNYASTLYSKVKNMNGLTNWGLDSVEGGIYLVVDASLVLAPLVNAPLSVVDDILFKGLEQIELRVPALTYPPELLVRMTKDYFSTKLIRPVMKRADSVKQLGLNGATRYGVLAVDRIDTALDIADRYVEKYLPDAADTTDKDDGSEPGDETNNKRAKTIRHANRLSRKLRRRLTNKTIAEAKALRQQSIHTLHCLLYLADLMLRDPVLFAEKMKLVWMKLSEDEPENQVPPANLEQLVSMLVRETSRKMVHATNFTLRQTANVPALAVNTAQAGIHAAQYALDYLLKIVHLDGLTGYAVATARGQIDQMILAISEVQKLVLAILDSILSRPILSAGTVRTEPIPLPPPEEKDNRTTNSNNEQNHENNTKQNNTSGNNDVNSNDKPPY